MSDNPFVLPKEAYQRDLNIVAHYVDQSAAYLAKMTGQDIDACRAFVKRSISEGGRFAFKDPKVVHTERGPNGDREIKTSGMLEYIRSSIREREIIAPTLTTYLHPSKKQSLLVNFIDDNVKKRGIAKKAMFRAEMAGDTLQYLIQKNTQANKKISNNSLSGAHVSKSTPLFNKTAHSSLTSTCRSTSGYGNANNEKFLSGNRHYFNPRIVRNNITSIITNTDYKQLQALMEKYGLKYPTTEDVMKCIRYSAMLYWREEAQFEKLQTYVEKLTPLEKAAFVYTGDLYHLKELNPEFVRGFLTELFAYIGEKHADPASVFSLVHEDIKHLACQICPDETRGVENLKETEGYGIVASTALNVHNTLQKYQDLIRGLWVTPNVPASVAHFPDSIRRAALVSDTDSTIFTVQDWVIWYFGKPTFRKEAMGLAAGMIFLTSQTITHVLARMSANFGIVTDRIHQIAMKNEFKFDVFVPTQVGKHYFALIGCQEGNLFAKHKAEIKGVHLRSSNAPPTIMAGVTQTMKDIMQDILEEREIDLCALLTRIGNVEREIIASVKRGSYEYLRLAQIKDAEAYTKSEEESPYQHYILWNEVFGPKYGVIPPPPYTAVKVSTELDTPVKMRKWLDELEDRDLANRMQNWLDRMGKKKITTFQLPDQVIGVIGLPDEIFRALDIRKIVFDATSSYYTILEALGVFLLNKRQTKLIHDLY